MRRLPAHQPDHNPLRQDRQFVPNLRRAGREMNVRFTLPLIQLIIVLPSVRIAV